MRRARQAPAVAVIYFATVLSGFMALSRFVGGAVAPLPPPPGAPATLGECVAWFVLTCALLIVSIVLYFASRNTEHAECEITHQGRACQAQRNATIFSGSLLLTNSLGAIVTLLALTTFITLRNALVVYAILALPLESAWYLASTIPYAPLPRWQPGGAPPPHNPPKISK